MKKLAIIGCGGIGSYHLGHFLKIKDVVKLVGFCDLIEERAQGFVDRAESGKAYVDFRKMYDETKPDMVFICIPPTQHGEIELETIARGIPFFVEKPTGLDIKLIRKINDAVEKAGLITAVGFQCRYDDFVEPVRQFVKDNKVVYINCTRFSKVPGAPWWKDKTLSGGQLVEMSIHNVDYIRYTYGEPKTVYSTAARGFVDDVEDYNTDDISVTTVRFENGALGSIATGCYARAGEAYDSKIIYSAKDKRMEMRLASKLNFYEQEEVKPTEESGIVLKNDGYLKNTDGSVKELNMEGDFGMMCDRTFIDAVITGDGSKIRASYKEAMGTMAFVLACNRSMETGLPVNVADMLKD